MDIGNGEALGEEGEAADLDVLADDEDHLLSLLGDGELGAQVLALQQLLEGGGLVGGHGGGNALDEVHELLVLAHEVGLGVDLDDHAHTIDDGGVSHALGGDAAGLLGGSGQALLPQELHGLVHVAVRGGQGLLAVHHAHAGHLAQGLHIGSSKCHFQYPPIFQVSGGAFRPSRQALGNYSADSSLAASSICSPCLPSSTALAMMEEISLMARMASSLPGMT